MLAILQHPEVFVKIVGGMLLFSFIMVPLFAVAVLAGMYKHQHSLLRTGTRENAAQNTVMMNHAYALENQRMAEQFRFFMLTHPEGKWADFIKTYSPLSRPQIQPQDLRKGTARP